MLTRQAEHRVKTEGEDDGAPEDSMRAHLVQKIEETNINVLNNFCLRFTVRMGHPELIEYLFRDPG